MITPLLPPELDATNLRILANPTGVFELGGPHADTGLTGRKIIVDTYGGMARHGGGAFSGKDPSKVDRSAAYAARWVAKNLVAAGAATRCEVQVAYAIGVARPVSVLVETFGTERVDPDRIAQVVDEVFDLRPAAIVRDLDLKRPIYRKTAAYGHFGRSDKEFTWEDTSRARRPEAGARTLSTPRRAGRRDRTGWSGWCPTCRPSTGDSTTSCRRPRRRPAGGQPGPDRAPRTTGRRLGGRGPGGRPRGPAQAAGRLERRRTAPRTGGAGRVGGVAVGRPVSSFLGTASPPRVVRGAWTGAGRSGPTAGGTGRPTARRRRAGARWRWSTGSGRRRTPPAAPRWSGWPRPSMPPWWCWS